MNKDSNPVAPFYELATVVDPPYVMKNGSGGYKGFVVDLLDKMSDTSGFHYSLNVINDTYGFQQADGTWNGLIGKVVTLPADMAVGAIAKTIGREKVIQFTETFHSTSVQLLLLRPSYGDGVGGGLMLTPFTPASWVLLFLAVCFAAVMFFLIGKFDPNKQCCSTKGNDVCKHGSWLSRLMENLAFITSCLLFKDIAKFPKTLAGKTLSVGWFSFILLILLAYSSSMTSIFSTRPNTLPALTFRSYEDILKDRSIELGIIRNGDVDSELSARNGNLEKQLYEYVSYRHNFVGSLKEGIQRMRASLGQFALLLPSYKARYLASKECDLITYGHGLGMLDYAFGFPAGSFGEALSRRINSAILMMRKTGTLETLQHKWDGKGGNCPDPEGSSLPIRKSGSVTVGMSPIDLALPLSILCLTGCMAGLLTLIDFLLLNGVLNKLFRSKDIAEIEASVPLNAKDQSSILVTNIVIEGENEDREKTQNATYTEHLEQELKDFKPIGQQKAEVPLETECDSDAIKLEVNMDPNSPSPA